MRPSFFAALALTIAASGCAASAPGPSSVAPSTASTGAISAREAEAPFAASDEELAADGAAGAARVPSAAPLEASATDGG
ncbi:MAG: hypothetical protein WBY94_00900, partial [Polyangiaceae bacterium]